MPLSLGLLNLNGFVIDHFKGINPVKLFVRFTGSVQCPSCRSYDLRKKPRFCAVFDINLLEIDALKFSCAHTNIYVKTATVILTSNSKVFSNCSVLRKPFAGKFLKNINLVSLKSI